MRILAVMVVLSTVSFAQAPASSLPPVVKAAFEKAYPGATISSTSQERDGSRTAFRVDGSDGRPPTEGIVPSNPDNALYTLPTSVAAVMVKV